MNGNRVGGDRKAYAHFKSQISKHPAIHLSDPEVTVIHLDGFEITLWRMGNWSINFVDKEEKV